MAELAQRSNGLGRHRHMPDGSRGLGHAVAVVSTKPVGGGTASALRDAHVTDQATKERSAEFCNGQAITQRLNRDTGADQWPA